MRIPALTITALSALAAAIAPTLASAADIADADGAVIGKATFERTPTGVLMSVDVSGLPPGGHGIDLHAVGSCTPSFKAATGHINPGKARHGLRNPEGPDNGDLPNLRRRRRNGEGGVFHHPRLGVRRQHARPS